MSVSTLDKVNVLFFSAGNSARSILAEAMLNRIAASRFCAFSAGSLPSLCLDPQAIGLLRDLGYTTTPLRSKSWVEFLEPTAPVLDVIVNLGGMLPIHPLPGNPLVLEWEIPDVLGASRSLASEAQAIYGLLEDRITQLAGQPLRALLNALRHHAA